MLSRITKALMWAAVLLRNPVVAQEAMKQNAVANQSSWPDLPGLDLRILNQTPVILANAELPQRANVAVVAARRSNKNLTPPKAKQDVQPNSYMTGRNAQLGLDHLDKYLELILSGIVGVPLAIWAYFQMVKQRAHHVKNGIIHRILMQSKIETAEAKQTSRAQFSQAAARKVSQSSAAMGTHAPSPVVAGASDGGHLPKNPSVFARTSARQTRTAEIRARLAQRRAESLAAKAVIKTVQPIKERKPSLKTTSATTSALAAASKTVTHEVAASSSALAAAPSVKKMGARRPTALQQRLNTVKENVAALADIAESYRRDSEEIMDDASLRVRQWLALYHLHCYNLSVLQLMLGHPLFRGPYYVALVLPLRLELAHFSSETSQAATRETMESLQLVLANFRQNQERLSAADMRNFIGNMSGLLEKTPIGQSCLARVPEKTEKAESEKEKKAHAAYEGFIHHFLPEMQLLAARIKKFDRAAARDAHQFSYQDYIQAFGMLVMMSCDRLPPYVLMRLRKKPAIYPVRAVFFMSQVHRVRNCIAHSLVKLPEPLVEFLCDRVERLTSEHQPELSLFGSSCSAQSRQVVLSPEPAAAVSSAFKFH